MLKARPAIIAVVGGQSFVRVFELFLVSVPRLESWESESHVHIDGKEKKMEGKKKRRRRAGVGNDYPRNVLPSSVVLGDKISLGQEEREKRGKESSGEQMSRKVLRISRPTRAEFSNSISRQQRREGG